MWPNELTPVIKTTHKHILILTLDIILFHFVINSRSKISLKTVFYENSIVDT